MASTQPIVVARDLGRTFGTTRVLREVDLAVRPGEVVGLIGPNGGGKSTLLVLLAGLVTPSEGTVTVEGVAATDLARTRTGRVGLITADAGLYPLLTGTENLRFFASLFGLSSADCDGRADPLIAELGLERAMERPVSEWSSGMRQKLSLVRALLLEPALLLLDEPTANLDALAAQTIYEAVRRRADAGIAVVLATHDLVAAEGLCDRVAVVKGTLVTVQDLEGPRHAPEPGRLLALLQQVEGVGVIRRVLLIARREWLEQLRQPWMLAVIFTLFAAIGLLVTAALFLLNHVAARPELAAELTRWLPFGSERPEELVAGLVLGTVSLSNWLIFTQFLGIVAVLAGHSVLHDHQSHTLPFLLLAPISRAELLLGKVLGALGLPYMLYVFVSGTASVAVTLLPVTAPVADRLPPSAGWVIAFLAGGPLWAMVVASLCAIVSTVSRDVRTAQQAVWFVMFFATFVCGYLLAVLVPDGATVQAGVALAGALTAWGCIAAGSQIVSRDLRRS